MKYLSTILTLTLITILLTPTFSSITNTTKFFTDQTASILYYQSYTGYEEIDWYYPKQYAGIYYSLWQGLATPWSNVQEPLIIWLQGGPGAPSQFGCFNQIGPISIQGNQHNFTVIQNTWNWNFFGHLMCVDQPIGVGFSYNNNEKKVNNTLDAAKHFVNFLSNFFKNNANFNLSHNPIYLAGENYAGHYLPAIAELMLTNTSLSFNLIGMLLGNGWVDPTLQSNNYYDSFLNSVGAVSNYWRDTTSFMQNQAIIRIDKGYLKQASGYINFIINNCDVVNKYYNWMNVLNYKQFDQGNINLHYSQYLESKKNEFGVPDSVRYVAANQQMYNDFSADISTSYKRPLQLLLTKNLNILIYNGQNDFIVNTAGVITYLHTLDWTLAKQWKNTEKRTWKEYGSINLGWFKHYGNLNFVMIRNAGNLVPSDQPWIAWNMLKNYFFNAWYQDNTS